MFALLQWEFCYKHACYYGNELYKVETFFFFLYTFLLQGNVELWLGELLKNIRKSIHTVIRTAHIALQDKENFNLIEFENTYAAQVGLLGIQMIWTRDSEDALKNARSDRKVRPLHHCKSQSLVWGGNFYAFHETLN